MRNIQAAIFTLMSLAGPGWASLIPDSEIVEFADSEPEFRVVHDGAGSVAVIWRDSHLRARVLDVGDGLSEAIDVSGNAADYWAAAAESGYLAVASGGLVEGCELVVLDTAGLVVSQATFNEFDTCRIDRDALTWLDAGRVAFAMVGVDEPNTVAFEFPRIAIFDVPTGDRQVVSVPVDEMVEVISLKIDAGVDRLVTTAEIKDDEEATRVQHQVFDDTGQVLSQPFFFSNQPGPAVHPGPEDGYRIRAQARFSGSGEIVVAGNECAGERCGVPVVRWFGPDGDLNRSLSPGALFSGLLAGTPAAGLVLQDLRGRPSTGFVATWGIKEAESLPPSAQTHLIFDASGEIVRGFDPYHALTDTAFQLEQGVDSDSVSGVKFEPGRMFLVWHRDGRLVGRSFRVTETDAPEISVRLSVDGACAENRAWTRVTVFGLNTPAEIRQGNPSGQLVGIADPASSRLETLAQFGDAFFVIDPESELVLATAILLEGDFSVDCTPDRLSVTAITAPDSLGLFAAEVQWQRPRSNRIERIEIRLREPGGKLFVRAQKFPDARQTGNWVREGMLFFLLGIDEQDRAEVLDIAIARP